MRILIAEDERVTRASLTRQLQGWGHEVVAAEDGEAAWEAFRAGAFDIVITDWEMPHLSGLELIRRIRSSETPNFIYVMMLTGRTDKSDLVSGIEAGANDYLSKPFDREELRVRVLSGERVVRLERTLSAQNVALREANERVHRDLRAAAAVQQSMLPKQAVKTQNVRTAWKYVPTDELAGDAVGLELIDDRYLLTYVLDVSGHGVPAALLSVTAMHALAPSQEGASLLRAAEGAGGIGPMQRPSRILSELNRRFCAGSHDGRFLTAILCVVDTHTGRMQFSRAGHPLPILVRNGKPVEMSDEGGAPLGVVDGIDYEDVSLQFEPGDRMLLYSDGIPEQPAASGGKQFGDDRLCDLFVAAGSMPGDQLVTHAVDALAQWAGSKSFIDDVSIAVVDWQGH